NVSRNGESDRRRLDRRCFVQTVRNINAKIVFPEAVNESQSFLFAAGNKSCLADFCLACIRAFRDKTIKGVVVRVNQQSVVFDTKVVPRLGGSFEEDMKYLYSFGGATYFHKALKAAIDVVTENVGQTQFPITVKGFVFG